ncbi:MAG: thiamine diphosphokinase [Lachnospiraceae bacterium]|nr:thiamine diphosphokinase [Lachnospiraceae bacterium]
MNKRCLIISGGNFEKIAVTDDSFVVACDKGYEYALRCGIRPDLIVGDFDSYDGNLPDDIEIIRLQEEKDDTDTLYALKEVIKRGAKDIEIVCALGARLDHEFSNLQTLVYAVEQGVNASITSERMKIYAVRNGRLDVVTFPGQILSVFSISDKCEGVCISGTHYDVDGIELKNSMPLGQSNYAEKSRVSVSVRLGTLIVMVGSDMHALLKNTGQNGKITGGS